MFGVFPWFKGRSEELMRCLCKRILALLNCAVHASAEDLTCYADCRLHHCQWRQPLWALSRWVYMINKCRPKSSYPFFWTGILYGYDSFTSSLAVDPWFGDQDNARKRMSLLSEGRVVPMPKLRPKQIDTMLVQIRQIMLKSNMLAKLSGSGFQCACRPGQFSHIISWDQTARAIACIWQTKGSVIILQLKTV